jgi:hypothetical protein
MCPVSGLVTENDLKAWLGINRRTALEKRLRELRIPYVYGAKNVVCTTQAAIDNAISGVEIAADQIEFQ